MRPLTLITNAIIHVELIALSIGVENIGSLAFRFHTIVGHCFGYSISEMVSLLYDEISSFITEPSRATLSSELSGECRSGVANILPEEY